MLGTDAYTYLNIEHPMCAWATYRGVLVCAPNEPGFVSVWTAGLLRPDNIRNANRETAIEAVRAAQFPERISRLQGMFCLPDEDSAKRAESWDDAKSHFQRQYLAEISLAEAGPRRDRLDANWITNADFNANDELADYTWIPSYWSGKPYPKKEPIWETLVDGRLIVLGTEIRQRAYTAIKSEFPYSLMFLEITRQAAVVGSDLGTISAFLHFDNGKFSLTYAMNMVDAENPAFLSKIAALKESGHPINWADIAPHVERDSFGLVPDFRPYNFSISTPIAR